MKRYRIMIEKPSFSGSPNDRSSKESHTTKAEPGVPPLAKFAAVPFAPSFSGQ